MKKILLLLVTLVSVLTLAGCNDVCVGTDCADDDVVTVTQPEVEGLIFYDHINGHGVVVEDHNAFILFEEELQGWVKYQVAYLSCTCRPSDVNYWNVIYIEVNKYTDDVRLISFSQDDPNSTHPYTPGLWGDSSPTPGGKYMEDFAEQYIPWLIGKTMEDLDGISVFTNEDYHGILNTKTIDDATYTDPDTNEEIDLIDDFAGSSVSTNNMLRIVKSILEHHEENYGR